jgi:hypothetical protein
MGVPVSLLLIGLGAALTWAVQDRSRAINLDAVGIILMIVGAIGLLLTIMWWDRLGWGYGRRGYAAGTAPGYGPRYGRRSRQVVVEEDAAPPVAPGPPAPPPAPPPDY